MYGFEPKKWLKEGNFAILFKSVDLIRWLPKPFNAAWLSKQKYIGTYHHVIRALAHQISTLLPSLRIYFKLFLFYRYKIIFLRNGFTARIDLRLNFYSQKIVAQKKLEIVALPKKWGHFECYLPLAIRYLGPDAYVMYKCSFYEIIP